MDSNLMQEKISYAFTLGLQFNNKENATESESGDNCDENSTIQMNHVPEPSLVYTLKMKHKIDGVDWRRENRWKNVNVQASDGFSLLFHGSLLRQVTDYFLPVSLSTPDAPMEDFYCPSFKKDGLLALYDLIYKGYATIPRNMVIDILIQLSAIDSTLIKQEMFENPDPKDSKPKSEKSTIVDRKQIKKRLTFKQRMARLFLSYNKFRPKKKLQMKQKWKVTTIPESSQPIIDYHEPTPSLPLPITYPQSSSPSSSPSPPRPSPSPTRSPTRQLSPLSSPIKVLAICDSNQVPIEKPIDIQTIDLATPDSSPMKTPQVKSPSNCPESSSELLMASSSPSPPSTPPPIELRKTLIPPSMLTESSKPNVYKRARMSTSRGSYLQTIRTLKQRKLLK
ncbi:uncharacterized protein LOC128391244 [Panonychus citri]|uniref:uncharacterized protein LOC128391244 n=1 Tax=Panonychus citri TaxID=50023 RepID=UPI0023071BA8|nr:uncharacterized protein LOC128391244 [Panonychus citri]